MQKSGKKSGAVHSGDHADLSINVHSATHHTPQSNVGIDIQRNIELFNILIKAQHIAGSSNAIDDALSRGNFQLFRKLVPFADQYPEVIPDHLWQI